MKITNLAQFEAFLKSRIPTREALFMGTIGLDRAKYFMKLLGNPQNRIKVIHIAGTSGKGSTVHLASHLLRSQGFSVGLSISPHVFDIRERMQINNEMPDEKLVLKYLNQILPTILKMEKCKYGMPTFFEINVALAYHMFAQEKLNYAVMETGLGGTLDATNTVTRKDKICVITKIGLDHTEILGKTVAKIAEQKAGIIGKQNIIVNIQQTNAVQTVISKKCLTEKSQLLTIKNKINYSVCSSNPLRTIFDFNFSNIDLENIELGLIGLHQAENCALALACLTILSQREDFNINEISLRESLKNIRIPGRLEIRKMGRQTLIIDGAHNPQKMEALTGNLSKLYPKQKFTFIVAFKKGKDYKAMLKKIIPLADKILLTQFSVTGQDNHWSSTDNTEISVLLKYQKFKNFSIISNKHSDILQNVRMSKKPVIITGSLYLIGLLYPHFKK
jgi:dihydrofolate synthase/folylpolyglutamate synthase